MVKDLKEWEGRVRAAMKPPEVQQSNFSPGIQDIRKTANKRRPQPRGRQLPTAR